MRRRGNNRRRLVVLDADEWDHLPPDVLIPVHSLVAGTGEALVELREMTDRRTALLVYSTVERLIAGWGEKQSAMRMPSANLPTLRRRLRFHALLLDIDPRTERTSPLSEPEGVVRQPLPLTVDDATGDPIVYVPSRPLPSAGRRAELELQPTAEGKRALMTYSSRASLLHCCGPNQYFVAFPAGKLADVLAESGADTVLIDLPLPQHLRH
jgi:hypothetical protein